MNRPQPREAGHSLEEWKTWDGRWELIGGRAYDMTPSPGTVHQRTLVHLGSALFTAVKRFNKDCGSEWEALPGPLDVFLGQDVVEPDLIVVCDPRKVSEQGIEGPPDLIVEILSLHTACKDLTRKWWLYEAAGVIEYLIVDPAEKVGRLLRLEQGRYQDAAHVEWGQIVGLLGGRIEVPLGDPAA